MAGPEPVAELIDRYREAAHAKDVDAFSASYDESVRVFDLWGRWAYDGAAAWRANVAEWFGSLGDEGVAVEFDDVRSVLGDDLAAVTAFITFKGLSAEGAELRAMNNRITWALRRTTDGAWKIVHEHTSAPVDFETAKVLLQR